MRRLALFAALALATACAGRNATLVAKFSATATYHTATYEHRCQNTGGNFPPECTPCKAIINESVWQAQVADVNKKQGYLPPEEQADIERLIKALSSCP